MKKFTEPTIYDCGKTAMSHKVFPFIEERPERIRDLDFVCDELGLAMHVPGAATPEQLHQAHDAGYVEFVRRTSSRSAFTATLANLFSPRLQIYTRISPGTYNAAVHAAGAVCQAVDGTLAGHHQRSFCIVRPPGHHAGINRGEGFCIFNNVAIGALHSIHSGAKRVAIIDFDMHHGNGTEGIIRERGKGKILFMSSFEHGSKYSGDGALRLGVDGLCKVPIPRFSRYDDIKKIYRQFIIPIITDWEPEIIFISAGFDMHEHDPLTQLRMSSRDYYSLTRLICDVADKVCGGRVISVLEGGYEIKALEESVRYHLRALKPKNTIE